jgi:hypothetical protein
LQRERHVAELKVQFHQAQVESSLTNDVMEWLVADLNLAFREEDIAKKRLELFDLTGEADLDAALNKLEAESEGG